MTYPNLQLLLQATNRRRLFVNFARTLLVGAALLVVALLIALLLDAIFALPVALLLVVDGALLAMMMIGIWQLGRVVRRERFDARRVARLIEQRLGIANNALINALDLRDERRSTISRSLIRESVARREHAAQAVDVARVVEARPARRALPPVRPLGLFWGAGRAVRGYCETTGPAPGGAGGHRPAGPALQPLVGAPDRRRAALHGGKPRHRDAWIPQLLERQGEASARLPAPRPRRDPQGHPCLVRGSPCVVAAHRVDAELALRPCRP